MDTNMLIGVALLAALFAAGVFIKNHVALIVMSVVISLIAIYGGLQTEGGLTAMKVVLYLLVPICIVYAGRGISSLVKRGVSKTA